MEYDTFQSWFAVLVHVDMGEPIYYHAPLDYHPVRVRAERRRGQKVRVFPPSRGADPFTTDADHLPRFKRHRVEVQS